MTSRRLAGIMFAVLIGLAQPVLAEDQSAGFDMNAEIKSALGALDEAYGQLGGMGGLGTIPDDDLSVIQGLLGDAEGLIRTARRHAQDAESPQDEIWAVGYARAGEAMVEVADQYRKDKGY